MRGVCVRDHHIDCLWMQHDICSYRVCQLNRRRMNISDSVEVVLRYRCMNQPEKRNKIERFYGFFWLERNTPFSITSYSIITETMQPILRIDFYFHNITFKTGTVVDFLFVACVNWLFVAKSGVQILKINDALHWKIIPVLFLIFLFHRMHEDIHIISQSHKIRHINVEIKKKSWIFAVGLSDATIVEISSSFVSFCFVFIVSCEHLTKENRAIIESIFILSIES